LVAGGVLSHGDGFKIREISLFLVADDSFSAACYPIGSQQLQQINLAPQEAAADGP